jgi:hypothetical protein
MLNYSIGFSILGPWQLFRDLSFALIYRFVKVRTHGNWHFWVSRLMYRWFLRKLVSGFPALHCTVMRNS